MLIERRIIILIFMYIELVDINIYKMQRNESLY
jgi:hypothetical protein